MTQTIRRESAGSDGVVPQTTPVFRSVLFVTVLLLVWVSTAPFKGGNAEITSGSNLVNQLAFSVMALLSIAALSTQDREVLRLYWRPAWATLLIWIAIGVVFSNTPEVSLRSFLFLATVIIMAAAVVVMPSGQRQFAALLGGVALGILALNYAGLVLVPELAIHSAADRAEPEHAGSWRGLFDHKNIAGSMMGIFIFIGIFVLRAQPRWLGALIVALALGFLLNSASKTATGVTPAILLFWLVSLTVRNATLKCLVLLGPLAILLIFTLGSVLLPPVHDLLQAISPGQTFTGRTELWGFAIDRLGQRAVLGYGLEGFWGSDTIKYAEMAEDETGISNTMVHGHNSFLDSAMNFGIVGSIFVFICLVVLPMKDFFAARRFPENRLVADLMLQICLFSLYSACLESFFFRRADPVWFALLFAVISLRFLAHFRLRA